MVWGAIVEVRSETPAGIVMSDVFPEDQLQQFFFNTPELQRFLTDIDVKTLSKKKIATAGNEIEKCRPFIGEYIYSLYEAYRTLTLRVFVMTALGIANKKVEAWYRDDGNRTLVMRVLTVDEQAEFERSETKFNYIRNAIEKKIIEKAARIVSGEASAAHMLEQGTQILDAVHRLNSALNKQGIPAS